MPENTINNNEDLNQQILVRKQKLAELRKNCYPFPNDFKPKDLAKNIYEEYSNYDKTALEQKHINVIISGRIMTRRLMGKASFVHIKDMSGKIQVYIKSNNLPDGLYNKFKHWDIGDIIGIEGYLFKTKTGELSVHADNLKLLTKALRPLPDKYHGLQDQELRYRQRYVDLIVNENTQNIFYTRSKIIQGIRNFLLARKFLEVETPMMQVLPGGAAARPFVTHHNSLNMDLYLRVAPELYLKRLVVGGFDKVFEINRNFRNEGLSTRHNPEFTMVEFYEAYADYDDAMDNVELLMRDLAKLVFGKLEFSYQGYDINLSKKFQRYTVLEAIGKYSDIDINSLADFATAKNIAKQVGVDILPSYGLSKLQLEIFDKVAEHKLIEPTFITQYPIEVSPLARRQEGSPDVTDRAEFYCGGRELANMFSELNDPEDQAERFLRQVEDKKAGDDEAMPYDEDYITALEYGMPPTAGCGIGIDRLVMLFTDSASIRDVILFPHMRRK